MLNHKKESKKKREMGQEFRSFDQERDGLGKVIHSESNKLFQINQGNVKL